MARSPGLPVLLGEPLVWRPWSAEGQAVAGWGRKKSFYRAARLAARAGMPTWSLEDGFLRSVGFGQSEPALSLVVDDLGIYYDARSPSRLEQLVAEGPTDEVRARSVIAAWKMARVSKYNHARDFAGTLPESYVLVADQTLGDASIRFGMADAGSFERMLDAALAEHPDATVILKVHPEVLAGRKRGHFDLPRVARIDRVMVLGDDVHPVSLIERAKAVYTVTSQIGFEALLWSRPVRVFGMPFYAGWGLTQDELTAPVRRRAVSLERLVYAALVSYPRYLDPETGGRCEVERVIAHLRLQRQMRNRFAPELFGLGFSFWKRGILPAFVFGSRLRFAGANGPVPDHASVLVWGNQAAPENSGSVLRLEDGFLRSVGLGADLVRPLSWVVDDLGIYYDATRPSRLESILADTVFDTRLLQRAAALRQEICRLSVTKYNVSGAPWSRPAAAQRVILVPGQVESDASIAFGAPGVRRNIDLLRAVRAENPDAFVVYKPHPDVVAGLRSAGSGENEAAAWCDEVLIDCPMGDLLQKVDEVHVLTSLAGFEALLRGRRVVCHGMPFYAGWGLTDDRVTCSRRTRRLCLDELVAGAIFLYPTYVSRCSGRFTTPERALVELLCWRTDTSGRAPIWRNTLRWLRRWGAN